MRTKNILFIFSGAFNDMRRQVAEKDESVEGENVGGDTSARRDTSTATTRGGGGGSEAFQDAFKASLSSDRGTVADGNSEDDDAGVIASRKNHNRFETGHFVDAGLEPEVSWDGSRAAGSVGEGGEVRVCSL